MNNILFKFNVINHSLSASVIRWACHMRHKVEDLTLFTIEQNVFSATKETIEELYLSSERNDNHESK